MRVREPSFVLSMSRGVVVLAGAILAMGSIDRGLAFTFVQAGGNQPANTVIHPFGYAGSGGVLEVSLGLHADFAYLEDDFQFSATQAASIWNNLISTTGNLRPSVEIPSTAAYDVWGVLVHEVGHTLGLAHPTLGSNYAKSTTGANGTLDLNAGADGVRGSSDDVRGDDISLNYFKEVDNDPFTLPASGVIDSTTYSQDLADLPTGHLYAAVGEGSGAANLFTIPNTEGMMVSGGSLVQGIVRRGLIADDVAGIRYAMSGVDELQGTSDDYTIQLKYVGVDSNANIVVRFDHPLTAGGAAAASIATDLVSGNHRAMRTGRLINYKPNPPGGQTWTFPVPVSVPVVIEQVTGSEVALRLPTTDGERYLISWAPTLEASSWSTDLVELVVNGTSVGKTGANSFIFIADAVETTIALTFTGAPPDRGFFAAYVLEGRAFTPPPP